MVDVDPSIRARCSIFWIRGEGKGDSDRSENVVVGDSVPDRIEEDFQPKKAPSPPAGDFGRGSRGREESDISDSSESVRCTPSNCKVILGVG